MSQTRFAQGTTPHLLFSARTHAGLSVEQLGKRLRLQMRWHERISKSHWCQCWWIEHAEGRRGETAGYTDRYVALVLKACGLS
jgi:hypothetical protein